MTFLPILADSSQPLVQTLVFDALRLKPNAPLRIGYSLAIVAAVFGGMVSLIAMFCIWWERKVAGHIQSRPGPNRVGPIGLFQSVADGIKLLLKEDLRPTDADSFLFKLAPYLAFTPVFAAFLALPFGPDLTFEPRLNVGVFWILAILSLEIMGVILAGWASNNKWSIYGAMREACQMVSYEIPLGISIIVGVMTAGTLNMVELGHLQSGGLHTWLIFRNPFVFLSFFVYFVASLASNKRAPFDLPESESELVAGFHTEYSGLRFSFFFFAEYAAMFIVGGIQTALFLGGWNDPFGIIGKLYYEYSLAHNTTGLLVLNVLGAGIFSGKCLAIIFVQMWIRWTLPRPRIDQVLYACVKVLMPAAMVILLGAAVWQLLFNDLSFGGMTHTPVPWADYNPFSVADWTRGQAFPAMVVQILLTLVGLSLFGLVCAWVAFAFLSGRKQVLRLTDPTAIDEVPPSLVKA